MKALNDPSASTFEPTVFVTYDYPDIKNPLLRKYILDPYVRWARTVVRVDTDVAMVTHLLLYLFTSIPSAIYMFYNFHWWHGPLHTAMQVYYMGSYTLMMHQHIHMRGILSKSYSRLDAAFPYITDPLMGHTWNSYYFHHVKHHHVEANGPNDLSSTVRYQRDDIWHFLHYVGRFYFFCWFDLPRYFLRTRKPDLALKAGGFEVGNYLFLYCMFSFVNARATCFVFLIPLAIMRLGMMIGNWAQHAFVDEVEPDSDFRSSITVIDVAVRLLSTLINRSIANSFSRATATASTMATIPRTTSTPAAIGASTPLPSSPKSSSTPTSTRSSSTTSTT
jgi:hypothetical protein